jgi:hypothetical protein
MKRLLQNLWRQPPRDRVIDLVAQNPEGNVILGIVDLTSWGSIEKHLALQERINLCMEFLDSGELHKEFPNAVGKQVTIRLYLGVQPDPEGLRFLGAVAERIRSFGVGFEYQRYEG